MSCFLSEGSYFTGLPRRRTTLLRAAVFPSQHEMERVYKCEPGYPHTGWWVINILTLLVAPWKPPHAADSYDWPVWRDSGMVHTCSIHSWDTKIIMSPAIFSPANVSVNCCWAHSTRIFRSLVYQIQLKFPRCSWQMFSMCEWFACPPYLWGLVPSYFA